MVNCSCSICKQPVTDQDLVSGNAADHYVTDAAGDLEYIELAHLECAKAADPEQLYWSYG